MLVIGTSEDRTTHSPGGIIAGLAAPSQGSTELSTWRLRMPPGAEGPLHEIDHEQVLMPLRGTFTVTVDGQAHAVSTGQAAVLPAGVLRRIRVDGDEAEALVCMRAGGTAAVPGGESRVPLPWAR